MQTNEFLERLERLLNRLFPVKGQHARQQAEKTSPRKREEREPALRVLNGEERAFFRQAEENTAPRKSSAPAPQRSPRPQQAERSSGRQQTMAEKMALAFPENPTAQAAPPAAVQQPPRPANAPTRRPAAPALKRKKKLTKRDYWMLAAEAVAACVMLGAIGTMLYYRMDYKKGEDTYIQTVENYVQVEQPEAAEESHFRRLDIDFAALSAINEDICGWIDLPGFNASYPILQGATNDTYLHHMYTGQYNRSGSIFLGADYRRDFSDALSILYGHNMNNGTMFGGLTAWQEQENYDPDNYFAIYLPGQEPTYYRIKAFAQMEPDADFYFSQYELGSMEYQSFLTMAMANAFYDTGEPLDPTLPTLALSTCNSSGAKRLVAFCQQVDTK